MEDYHLARGHLLCIFQIKTSVWSQLPLALCCAAHPVKSVARDGLQRCLELFDAAGPHVEHHGLSFIMLSPEFSYRQEVEAFIAGAEWDEVPTVVRLAARVRFIPIAERWVLSSLESSVACVEAQSLSLPLSL